MESPSSTSSDPRPVVPKLCKIRDIITGRIKYNVFWCGSIRVRIFFSVDSDDNTLDDYCAHFKTNNGRQDVHMHASTLQLLCKWMEHFEDINISLQSFERDALAGILKERINIKYIERKDQYKVTLESGVLEIDRHCATLFPDLMRSIPITIQTIRNEIREDVRVHTL